MNNSDFIAKYLSEKGYDTAFGVTGGGAMFLNEAFRKQKKLKFVFTHHEQAASMAAEAYCRIKKKSAILSVTSGPGGTNAITGVIGSWVDSIPMLVFSGQVESKDMIGKSQTRQIGIQEANILDLIKPITKYAITLNSKSNIERELSKALKISETGRPGPVWIDIPLDVQSKKFINKKKIKKFKSLTIQQKKIGNLSKIYSMIAKSQRPLILIGNGIHVSQSEKEFLNLIKKIKIPILSTWNASDIIESTHRYYFGRPGLFGNRVANFAIQSCDLLLILGSRLSVPITGYQMKNFSPLSKKIYVDIDEHEIKKRRLKTKIRIKSDLKLFLSQLNKFIKNRNQIIKQDWHNKLVELKNDFNENDSYTSPKNYINSFNFIKLLSKSLKGNENIVTDMGTSFTCTMQSFQAKKKQRLFTSSGIAAMGFGLPGLIGTYFADKKKIPICITGDGGVMFNLQELQTIINYKIPAKIFILNNNGYLTMKLMQEKNFRKFVGSDLNSGIKFPNFIKLSKSLGFLTHKFNNEKKLSRNLNKILKSKKPTICEILMPPMQELIPRVQTQMNKDGTFEPSMIDNMYPFLTRKRLYETRKRLIYK
tara:strand:- start:1268 stop:3046 length:1779 start_codon:yes stop_codon:yes gene_type:complete